MILAGQGSLTHFWGLGPAFSWRKKICGFSKILADFCKKLKMVVKLWRKVGLCITNNRLTHAMAQIDRWDLKIDLAKFKRPRMRSFCVIFLKPKVTNFF